MSSVTYLPAARRPVVPSGVLAMVIFVICEVMFFAGLISAFQISAAGSLPGMWPPAGQPRLPVGATAINTGVLLVSGGLLFAAGRLFPRNEVRSRRLLLASILTGTFFVVFQGMEWLALLKQGLTIRSSTHGSFFYLIVGSHALHAVVALAALGWAWARHARGRLAHDELRTVQVFWTFVVGIWPVLYWQVYLS